MRILRMIFLAATISSMGACVVQARGGIRSGPPPQGESSTMVSGVVTDARTTRIRIENARKLMAHTQFTVAEVAALVGYDDPAYFSRVFRQETGVSPTCSGRTRQPSA